MLFSVYIYCVSFRVSCIVVGFRLLFSRFLSWRMTYNDDDVPLVMTSGLEFDSVVVVDVDAPAAQGYTTRQQSSSGSLSARLACDVKSYTRSGGLASIPLHGNIQGYYK